MFSALSGTILNIATVLLGGTLGVLVGNRLPARFQSTIFDGLGLITLLVGVQMALGTRNILYPLGGLLLGGIAGEAARIEHRLERFGELAQQRLAKHDSRFSEAFVVSSLVFCVGPLTIMGSIENGLTGNYRPLALKATLDLFSSFAFGASLGWGVLASLGTILVVQGGLALGAGFFRELMTPAIVNELTAAGGLLVMGIGLRLLELKRLPVANFLPALVVAPALVAIVQAI